MNDQAETEIEQESTGDRVINCPTLPRKEMLVKSGGFCGEGVEYRELL